MTENTNNSNFEGDIYHNPIDSKDYVSLGGWKVYAPQTTQTEECRRVNLTGMQLLDSQDKVAANLTTDSLVEYIKKVQDAVEACLGLSDHFELLVQFEFTNSEDVKILLRHNGEVSEETLQNIYASILSVTALHSILDPITVSVGFNVVEL